MPNLSDFPDQTRYNSRTAQQNAAAQDATRQAQLLSNINVASRTADPDQKSMLSAEAKQIGSATLSNTGTLDEARTTAADASQGKSTTTTFDASGKATSTAPTLPPSTGAIQDAERARLKAAGLSDGEILAREQANAPVIKDTASNTGLIGADVNPETVRAQRIAAINKRMQELSGPPPATVSGAPLSVESRAQIAADNARERLALQQELDHHQNQAMNGGASTTNTTALPKDQSTNTPAAQVSDGTGTQPTPGTEAKAPTTPMEKAVNDSITALGGVVASIAATAPPELQPLYQAALTMLQTRAADLSSQMTDTMAVADKVSAEYQTIVGGMLESRKTMLQSGQALLKSSQQEQLDLISQQKAADLAMNSNAQELFNAQVNNEARRREQELAVDTQHSMNAVAVQGGFGNLNAYAEIDRVHNVGEQQITNYLGEMAIQSQSYVAKALQIDAAYTSKVVEAHQNFNDKSLALMSTYNDKVEAAEKLLLGNSEKKMQAYAAARKEFRQGWTSIQSETISTIRDATKEAYYSKRQFDLETYRDRRSAWGEVNSYLMRFGNQMTPEAKTYLGQQETRLGLPPGTLTSEKVLAQMKKGGGGGGGGNPLTRGSTKAYVDSQRAILIKAHPELKGDPSAIDGLLLSATKASYPGAKNQAFLRDVSDYVNGNNIGSKPYYVNYDPANHDKYKTPTVDFSAKDTNMFRNLGEDSSSSSQ